jgi:predicted lipoprotein with Yx(FWY)xxD motif
MEEDHPMKKLLIPVVTIVAVAFAGVALAAPAMVGNSTKGKVLTNAKGMTLYTFAKDKNGKSACVGKCAQNWPPLMASAGEKGGKGYSEIKRDDGKMQWAYKGKPLYTWKNDKKPGDITGDGFLNGAWKIAKP